MNQMFWRYLFVCLFASCVHKSEVKPQQSCNLNHIGYKTCVEPVLKRYCIQCHATGNTSGGLALDDYETVKLAAGSGDIGGCVEHTDGYPYMPPQNQKIDTESLYIIRVWVDIGMPY